MTREKALLEFKRRMDKAGIEFSLGYGTCLAVYRDGTIFKDDHDIDISIFKSDLESVRKAIGYPHSKRGSRYNQFTFDVEGYKFDLVFWQKVGDEYNLNFRRREPDVLPEKFAELKPIEFLGETFMVPKYTDEYLEYYYGDWKDKTNKRHAIIRT